MVLTEELMEVITYLTRAAGVPYFEDCGWVWRFKQGGTEVWLGEDDDKITYFSVVVKERPVQALNVMKACASRGLWVQMEFDVYSQHVVFEPSYPETPDDPTEKVVPLRRAGNG